jgi:hypothetical protein
MLVEWVRLIWFSALAIHLVVSLGEEQLGRDGGGDRAWVLNVRWTGESGRVEVYLWEDSECAVVEVSFVAGGLMKLSWLLGR